MDFVMSEIEVDLKQFPELRLREGEYLLKEGDKTDSIYFLLEGSVEVIKDGYTVARIADRGAVFGEMSILLDHDHSASVRCIEDSVFCFIQQPGKYLNSHPDLIWHIARIIGLRLFNLTEYLVDVKRQYEGHDHLHMVDEVLDTLLNQQKTGVQQRGDSKRDTPDY